MKKLFIDNISVDEITSIAYISVDKVAISCWY